MICKCLAPPPPPRVAGRLLTGEGEGVGDEPNHTTARKPGTLYIVQYSLVIILKMHGQANIIISLQSTGYIAESH